MMIFSNSEDDVIFDSKNLWAQKKRGGVFHEQCLSASNLILGLLTWCQKCGSEGLMRKCKKIQPCLPFGSEGSLYMQSIELEMHSIS